MTRTIVVVLISAMVIAQYTGCSAATTRPVDDPLAWTQDIGETVVIYTKAGTWITGTLIEVGEDRLVLFVAGEPKAIAVANVEAFAVQGIEQGEPNEDRDLAVILLVGVAGYLTLTILALSQLQ